MLTRSEGRSCCSWRNISGWITEKARSKPGSVINSIGASLSIGSGIFYITSLLAPELRWTLTVLSFVTLCVVTHSRDTGDNTRLGALELAASRDTGLIQILTTRVEKLEDTVHKAVYGLSQALAVLDYVVPLLSEDQQRCCIEILTPPQEDEAGTLIRIYNQPSAAVDPERVLTTPPIDQQVCFFKPVQEQPNQRHLSVDSDESQELTASYTALQTAGSSPEMKENYLDQSGAQSLEMSRLVAPGPSLHSSTVRQFLNRRINRGPSELLQKSLQASVLGLSNV